VQMTASYCDSRHIVTESEPPHQPMREHKASEADWCLRLALGGAQKYLRLCLLRNRQRG